MVDTKNAFKLLSRLEERAGEDLRKGTLISYHMY